MTVSGAKSLIAAVAEKGTPISLEWVKLSNKEDLHKLASWMHVTIQNKRKENIELTNDEALKVNKQADGSLIFWFICNDMVLDEARIPVDQWTQRGNYDFTEMRNTLDAMQKDPKFDYIREESESKKFVRGEVHYAIIGREPAGIHMLHNFAHGVPQIARTANEWFQSDDAYMIFCTNVTMAAGKDPFSIYGAKDSKELYASIQKIADMVHDISKTSIRFYGLKDSVLDIANSKWAGLGGIAQT